MIKSVRLKNFKCFRDSGEIPLGKVNIFTGYNGAGKSSLFQSILLLAQSVEGYELHRLRANGKYVNLGSVSDFVTSGSDEKEFSIGIISEAPDYSLDFTFSPNSTNSRLGDLRGFILNGQDQFSTSGKIGGADESIAYEGGVSAKKEIKVADRVLQCADWTFLNIFRNIHYISANRLGPTLYEARTEVDSENPIGVNGEHRLEMLKSKPEIIENIESELSFILERDTKIVVGDGEESKSILNLSFKEGKADVVKSVNTGFGFAYVLPLLMAAECQQKGKIFVENPEAHLHPRAQSRLIRVLAKRAIENDNQLFVESHSEHIVNGIRLACLLEKDKNPLTTEDVKFYFFNEENRIVSLDIDEDAQLSPWPEGFFDQQQKDSAEILRRGLLK